MKQHEIEWEHKGTHEKHLSVLDFKKQEREEELNQLKTEIAEQQKDLAVIEMRCRNLGKAEQSLKETRDILENSSEFQLPEPQGLISAKTYKTRFADPLVKKLKQFAKQLLLKYFKIKDENYRLHRQNEEQSYTVDDVKLHGKMLQRGYDILQKEVQDYRLLRKAFGANRVSEWLRQAQELIPPKNRRPRDIDDDLQR